MKRLMLWLYVAAMLSANRSAGQVPPIYEEFNGWPGVFSPDLVWRRNGDWVATGQNLFLLDNCIVSDSLNGQPGGYLTLKINAGVNEGGEIQTWGARGSGFGFGYYEVRMQITNVPGGCVSFFWKEVNYGAGEIDLEFLTNESWCTSPATNGKVHCQLHPGNYGTGRSFSFNPTTAFHRYGFLWTPTKVEWYAERQLIQSISSPTPIPQAKGYIMMNAWTGSANWGGGPPTRDAYSYYDWVKYWPNVTSLPQDDNGIRLDQPLDTPAPFFTGPNPVPDPSQIRFAIPEGEALLYDLGGRVAACYAIREGCVAALSTGSPAPNGIYLLVGKGSHEARKIMLIK